MDVTSGVIRMSNLRRVIVLSIISLLLVSQSTPAQQREKMAKTDATLVVEGVVRQVFRSPRQTRTDYLVQIEVARSEARKTARGTGRMAIPAPGDSVYVHVYQLNDGMNRVASLDNYAAIPAERSQIKAYLTPRITGGWEGVFPDWYEVTNERTAEASPADPAPGLPEGPKEKATTSSLGMTSELIKVNNRTGLKVTSVERGGPAQKAGIEIGDVIMGVNGAAITSVEQLETVAKKNEPLPMVVVDVNTGRIAQIVVQPGEPMAGTPQENPKTNPVPPVEAAPAVNRSLGLAAEPVTVGQRTAMKISRVEPGSPAAKAGLEVNDVIVAANGTPITGPEQLAGAVRKSGPTLTLTVRDSRTGRDTPVEVALGGTSPVNPLPGAGAGTEAGVGKSVKLGAVTELTFYNVEAAVRITEVEPGSPAEKAGLRTGMLILEANGKAMLHPNELIEAVRNSGTTLKLITVDPTTGKKSPVNVSLAGG